MNHTKEPCPECNGTGLSGEHDRCDPPNYYVCDTCCGSGVIDKPCPYCEDGKRLMIKQSWGLGDFVNNEIRLFVEKNFLGINYKGYGFFVDINYCPMCGRKLENV